MDSDFIARALAGLTLEEKAGQLLMEDFVGRDALPADMEEALASGAVGAVLYFSGCNVESAAQLGRLNVLVRKASAASPLGLPALTAIDQEGGQLAAIAKGATVHPGNMALGAARRDGARLAEAAGRVAGSELASIGIAACFAPVVDIAHEEGPRVKDNRYYGSDPARAGELAAAYVRGLQAEGVIACAKHFPGQRNTEVDSHFALDVVPHDEARLLARELVPFRAAIGAGVGMVMSLHAAYPAIDPSGVPATLSAPLLGGLLRGKLGFGGIVVSDDIQMKPVMDAYGLEGALVRAINAGIDLIIVSKSQRRANELIAAAVRRGEISPARLDEAAARVVAAKLRSEAALARRVGRRPPRRANEAAALEAARAATTLLRNEGGCLPFPKAGRRGGTKRLAVIRPPYARLVMSDNTNFYRHTFKDYLSGCADEVFEYVIGLDPSKEEILGASDLAFICDRTLFCTVNAFEHPAQLLALEACMALAGPGKVAVAALRSPADAEVIPREVPALLLSYGVAAASVRALCEALFGDSPPSGALPLGFPAIPRGAGMEGY